MEVIDLTEKYAEKYFLCLEDWSDEIKEAGNHKELWFNKMKEKGLRVKAVSYTHLTLPTILLV